MTIAAVTNPTRSTQASGREGTAESSPISQYAMPRKLLLGRVVRRSTIRAERSAERSENGSDLRRQCQVRFKKQSQNRADGRATGNPENIRISKGIAQQCL